MFSHLSPQFNYMLFYTFTCQTNTNTTYIWPNAVFKALPIIQTETFSVAKLKKLYILIQLQCKIKMLLSQICLGKSRLKNACSRKNQQ